MGLKKKKATDQKNVLFIAILLTLISYIFARNTLQPIKLSMSNIHQTTAYSQVVTSVVNIISANNTTLHSNNSTNITDLGFTEENAWNIVG